MSFIVEFAASPIVVKLLDALIDITFPLLGLSRKPIDKLFGLDASHSIDERIRKIEVARDNLAEALSAIDELKSSAEDNKRELAEIEAAIRKRVAERNDLAQDNKNLRKLADIEVQTIRRALGLPTQREVWRGYILSFLGGILVTIAVSLAYDFLIKPAFAHFFHLAVT